MFVIRTPDGKQYRRNRKYLRKTNEKTFPSTTKPDIHLNKDAAMTDSDTRGSQTTHTRAPEYTVVAGQTPDEHSETLIQTQIKQGKLPVRSRE